LLAVLRLRLVVCARRHLPGSHLRDIARDIDAALEAGWPGFAVGERIPLSKLPTTNSGVGLTGLLHECYKILFH
jgi:hypothetical protein